MTTATLAGLVLIGGFVLLLLLRVPISFAMLLATLGSAMVTGTNFSVLVRQMVDGANNFSLLSIPFFIVMGEFMSAGGISEKIVDLANLAVGRFRGGLACERAGFDVLRRHFRFGRGGRVFAGHDRHPDDGETGL